MATVFSVKNTAGTLNITLQPGQLNGPGGAVRTTDQRLYGLGALLWGEGVNTNILRLTENFACPQKELGDNLPAYLGGTGPFPNTDYDPAIHPAAPKDEFDLGVGVGFGITTPLNGQSWFNTDSCRLVVFDEKEDAWVSSGGVSTKASQPTVNQEGDLWFDSSIDQLKIYVAGSPAGFQSVAERYLLKDGTTPLDAGYVPTSGQDIATKDYVDTEIAGTADASFVNVSGDTMDSAANLTFQGGGEVLGLPSAPSVPSAATSKAYVDGEIADLLAGTATGSPANDGVPVINPAGAPKDGDIRIDPGPEIFIYAAGQFRKVFPAVFAS